MTDEESEDASTLLQVILELPIINTTFVFFNSLSMLLAFDELASVCVDVLVETSLDLAFAIEEAMFEEAVEFFGPGEDTAIAFKNDINMTNQVSCPSCSFLSLLNIKFKELSSLLILPDHGISHILLEVTLEPLTIIKDSQHLALYDLVLSVESSDAPWYAAVDGGVISPLPNIDGLHVPDLVWVG